MQDANPHEALAAIRAARSDLAPPGNYPLVYDIAYGLICGLLLAGPGMPKPWLSIAIPIALFGLVGLMMWWRKQYGWWVSGYSPKRARWVASGLVAVFVGLVGLSLYGRSTGPDWLYMVSGILGFFAAIAGSRLWLHVWRRELAEGVG